MSVGAESLFQHATKAPETVIQLLEGTCIGTNGTRYTLLDTRSKIHNLLNPHFFFFVRNNKAIANVTICERDVKLNGEQHLAHYIRYVAFDKRFQGNGAKTTGTSIFHKYLKTLFTQGNLNTLQPGNTKKLWWAYIDAQNNRSFNLNLAFGFETIGTFITTAFSRVAPKLQAGVEQLKEDDKAETLQLIKEFYTQHSLFSNAHLFENDNYFILKKEGKICCGIQIFPVHWKIESLPGFSGKLMLKYAHKIPRIKKLINPNKHEFLATEGVFWKANCAQYLDELLEGVLHLTSSHSLLIWTDNNDKRIENLPIKWGFIQKMKAKNPIQIVAKCNHFTPKEISALKSSPKYLSGFDMT